MLYKKITFFLSFSLLISRPCFSNVLGHAGKIVERQFYKLSFDIKHSQPAWVAYELSFDPNNFIYSRTDNYREDPKLGSLSPKNSEYKGTGFDRGHLAPAQDFAFGLRAISDSFYLSNIAPQRADFNQRGLWRRLEDQVRLWSLGNRHKLFIIAGPVLNNNLQKIKKDSRITLAKKFFKIILTKDDYGNWQAIGFLFPHLDYLRDFSAYAVSVNSIEELTGLDFFAHLPNSVEEQIERNHNSYFWFGQSIH